MLYGGSSPVSLMSPASLAPAPVRNCRYILISEGGREGAGGEVVELSLRKSPEDILPRGAMHHPPLPMASPEFDKKMFR